MLPTLADTATAPRIRQYEQVQRRAVLNPSVNFTRKRTVPQWHAASQPERYLPRSSTSWVCVTSAQRGHRSHSSSASRLTAGALLILANVCRPAASKSGDDAP